MRKVIIFVLVVVFALNLTACTEIKHLDTSPSSTAGTTMDPTVPTTQPLSTDAFTEEQQAYLDKLLSLQK